MINFSDANYIFSLLEAVKTFYFAICQILRSKIFRHFYSSGLFWNNVGCLLFLYFVKSVCVALRERTPSSLLLFFFKILPSLFVFMKTFSTLLAEETCRPCRQDFFRRIGNNRNSRGRLLNFKKPRLIISCCSLIINRANGKFIIFLLLSFLPYLARKCVLLLVNSLQWSIETEGKRKDKVSRIIATRYYFQEFYIILVRLKKTFF